MRGTSASKFYNWCPNGWFVDDSEELDDRWRSPTTKQWFLSSRSVVPYLLDCRAQLLIVTDPRGEWTFLFLDSKPNRLPRHWDLLRDAAPKLFGFLIKHT
jgi:hypothetical protein